MKYTEIDLDWLVSKIKEFNAGAVDKALGKHIDECLEDLKEKKTKEKSKWSLW